MRQEQTYVDRLNPGVKPDIPAIDCAIRLQPPQPQARAAQIRSRTDSTPRRSQSLRPASEIRRFD